MTMGAGATGSFTRAQPVPARPALAIGLGQNRLSGPVRPASSPPVYSASLDLVCAKRSIRYSTHSSYRRCEACVLREVSGRGSVGKLRRQRGGKDDSDFRTPHAPREAMRRCPLRGFTVQCCKYLGRAQVVELPHVFRTLQRIAWRLMASAGLPTPPKRATAGLPIAVPLQSRSDPGGVGRPRPREDVYSTGLPSRGAR